MSSPTAMSVSGDEEDDGKRALKMEKIKEKVSNKCKEGGKSGGEVTAAAVTAAAKEQKASADGATDGKKVCRSPLKNALAKAKRTPGLGGAEFQQKAAVFPAKEGQPWVDPPLIMNPRVRGASRRVKCFFADGFQS